MNAHHIRLAALDMDGTLLRDDKTLSPFTRLVLQTLAERGLTLVPATGRVRNSLAGTILTIPSVSYAICANGAYIEDLREDRVLASWPLERNAAAEIAGYLQRLPVYFYMHTDQGTFRLNSPDPDWLKDRFPALDLPKASSCDLIRLLRSGDVTPMKVGIITRDRETFHQLLHTPLPVPGLRLMRTGPENIEINSASASKGNALRWLCRYLEIPPEQTLAVGDSQNDLEMLEVAGVSAAMENGLEEVRRKARFLCRSNQEDGAARFLAGYFGLRELADLPV